jgi:hypothetical protein
MKEKRNKFILESLSLSFMFLLLFGFTQSASQYDKLYLDPPEVDQKFCYQSGLFS